MKRAEWRVARSVNRARRAASALLLLLVALAPAAAQDPAVPYWASIDQAEARMRTGPSTDYPTSWLYRRERLPVKVLERYQAWRKVEDPDGVQGWMHSRLLSARPTGIVIGDQVVAMMDDAGGRRVAWRVEPGVVGYVTRCRGGWCLFDVTGRRGWIESRHLWGATEE